MTSAGNVRWLLSAVGLLAVRAGVARGDARGPLAVLVPTAMEAGGGSTPEPAAEWALTQREELAALFVQVQGSQIERCVTRSLVARANGLPGTEE